jgi:hypothetical protein
MVYGRVSGGAREKIDPPMDADHQSIEANADLTYGVDGGFFTPFLKSCPPVAICDSHPSPRQKKARVSHGHDYASENDLPRSGRHPHVVADMKRTAREKDWPLILIPSLP